MSSSFRKTDSRNGPILPHASPVLPTPPRASPVLPMPPRPSPVTPTPPRTPVMPEEEPEPVTRASFPSMSSISVPLTNGKVILFLLKNETYRAYNFKWCYQNDRNGH